jgi:hypothetical protein
MAQGNAPSVPSSAEFTSRFYNALKTLREFDQEEITGLVEALLSKTDREQCFLATYYRAVADVETLLTLENVRHFQAVAMLARGLFELAVDMRLLEMVAGATDKMILFADVEKLRCARKLVRYTKSHPNSALDAKPYVNFVSTQEARIDLAQKTIWPNLKKVSHWSGKDLAQRVVLIGTPFNEFHEAYYPLMSWYVHSGLTGIVNLEMQSLITMCGIAFRLAVESYSQMLLAMIREFQIWKGNEKVREKLEAARLLAFTVSKEQADQVFRELLG